MTRKLYLPRVSGPLRPYARGYYDYAQALGYTAQSAGWHVWVLARLSQWLESTGIAPQSLTENDLQAFLVHHRASKYRQPIGWRRLAPLLQYLRSQELIPGAAPPTRSPLQAFLERYQHFLHDRRGLAPRTIEEHVRTAHRFLAPWAHEDPSTVWAALHTRDVTTFLLRDTARLSPGAAKNVLQHLRSLLRFVHQVGYVAQDLALTLPPVASWHATRLPPTVSTDAVEALLAPGADLPGPGRRNYAVLLLLARLGLRATEICRLTLDDVDWRAGELVVSGKSRRVDRLPLPSDVGAALAAYLHDERPPVRIRELFLTCRAPIHGMSRGGVFYVVTTACRRRGLPALGPHRLRHALATTLLHHGVPLPTIGQVLRHRDLQSTAAYAKVDQAALRTVAQAWPEGSS